jgi:phosphoribosylformylglycinamidine synthase subunit PurQ / glutaminase
MIRFAVISFPGTTGESEAIRAFQRNGMEAEVILWNDSGVLKGSRLDDFDGYCLAGGMSYGDRGREGVIAAHQPIMEVIQKEATKGKVVLGIGNGAQILVESGLIPGYDNHSVACAVSSASSDAGSMGGWHTFKNMAPKNRSAFNRFTGVLHLPVTHGMGRFVSREDKVLEAIKKNGQVIFRYGDSGEGAVSDPQGFESVAAICSPAGNVLAILAHPERDPQGGGNPLFKSIREWIETRSKADYPSLGTHQIAEEIRPFESSDIEFIVRPMSVDSEKRTVEAALRAKGIKVGLKRYAYWSAKLRPGVGGIGAAEKILMSGELANLNKDWVYVRMGNKTYQCAESGRLQAIDLRSEGWLVVADKKKTVGNSKMDAIRRCGVDVLESMIYGTLWEVENSDEKAIYEIIRTKILYNPNSMYIMKN